jgi:serpin B
MVRRRLAISMISLGLLASSCHRSTDTAQQAKSPEAPIGKPDQRAVDGINSFSVDLYKRSVQPGGSVIMSPASISVTAGLAYRGAKGRTADELARVFHFDASPTSYLGQNQQLLAAMNFSGAGSDLESANAIWLQSNMPVKPDFEADVSRYADAAVQRVDFRQDSGNARSRVNDWVAQATGGKITSLLGDDDLDNKTRAVLVNAIAWNGRWEMPFDAQNTKVEPFTLPDGHTAPARLMHNDLNGFQVLQRKGVKAVCLPFREERAAMYIFLPDTATGLRQFERDLSYAALKRWLADVKAAPGQATLLTLPKLHLEWRRDVRDDLTAMGAPTAFGADADFSGIATLPYPGENPDLKRLLLNHVVHKAAIDITEDGAQAEAATAADAEVAADLDDTKPAPPFVFRADHAFFFVLTDERTGMILFMGRYLGPSAS